MAKSPSLDALSRAFVAEINSLLNTTVCDNVVLQTSDWRGTYFVSLNPRNPAERRGFKVGSDSKTNLYLLVTFQLSLDDSDQYLMVRSSVFALARDPEMTDELFHIDYERDKQDGYSDAHLQVIGRSDAWDALLTETKTGKKPKSLGKLHLPTGGTRYRPTLEDLLEFLVYEEFCAPHDDEKFESIVAESRAEFARKQLRAAIRRDLETAKQAVKDFS